VERSEATLLEDDMDRVQRSSFRLKELEYGFTWGPVTIERVMSHPKAGVILSINTPRETKEIRVTPSGLIRFDEKGKA